MKVIRNRFFNQTKESRFICQREFLQVIKLDISKKEKKKHPFELQTFYYR